MKKIVSLLIACVLTVVCATGFVGCGKDGANGENGKSAYEIWLGNGHSGTQADFLNWIKGEKGEQGQQGTNGQDGINGKDGQDGENGEDGQNGKSAYEIFKDYYPDYTGSELEWITAIAMGDKCALFGHKYNDGEITKQPTKDEEGEKTYTCSVCKGTKTEEIPKLETETPEIFEVDGKKYVNFGSYPQTHVSDENLIAELDKLTETNENGYSEYNGEMYIKVTVSPYHYGSYENEYGETVYYTYSDGAKITYDPNYETSEWFKVEPIKWRVLEENDNSIKVISELILNRYDYYSDTKFREIGIETIYPNNYEYSYLRKFLNNNFYNSAFTVEQQNAILTTTVYNRASSTMYPDNPYNVYLCNNTSDKVYELSYSEAFNSAYFANNIERQFKITDFAKAMGVRWDIGDYENYGYWWLRSPGGGSDSYEIVSSICNDGNHNTISITTRNIGVVPAVQISIA